MEQRIDTGAIVGQLRFPIRPYDTGLSLFREFPLAIADCPLVLLWSSC
jgi:hypothetical protein